MKEKFNKEMGNYEKQTSRNVRIENLNKSNTNHNG
jgi:hypothetical protein